ncbi:hypothetical protein Tco_0801091 [Tanacetum coccineum]|uniref:Uncharacterized protein n=1 Tax=Tanacetum coccineum TaxID=301880 RepID=A0ABQ4ZV26_9ASTR
MSNRKNFIRANVFGLSRTSGPSPPCLCSLCFINVVAEEQNNLAYFIVKRIECARATPTANLLYGMFSTRLYRYVMETYPHLDNGTYDIVERVMHPLALRQTYDDEDDSASRASTSSPTTYLNSLHPLNHHIPSSSEQIDETLFA